MKTLRTLLIMTTACLGIWACSDDDNNNTQTPDLNPVGTFHLVSVAITEEIDYNMDGNPSSELMSESGCYNGSFIQINEDGTFTSLNSHVDFLAETGCGSEEGLGSWTSAGDVVTLIDESMTEPVEIMYTISEDESTITTVFPNAPYPDRDEEGNPIYTEGAVTYIYQKGSID